MQRVVLVSWDVAEAEARAGSLRRDGFDAAVHSDRRANPRVLAADPPDVFLIDLGRSPSQGRELGGWLRRNRSTRSVPLVFVGGEPEKTEKVRALLPDATFTTWENAADALARAIAAPPADPAVPGAMDAYAGAPLVRKLGIQEANRIGLIDAPDGFADLLTGLPEGTSVGRGVAKRPDVVLLFVRTQEELDRAFLDAAKGLANGGKLWICWPKKASGVASDLSQQAVRAFGLARGFVDYKIASIDGTWSGLCFARRDVESRGR
jgi:CheY-like chemotaxis protein